MSRIDTQGAENQQADATPCILECSHVQKYFGSRKSITKALNGIDLRVHQGEFVSIMGPSGSGKTTLLNCISTIDKPTAGSISVNNTPLNALKGQKLARFRHDELGFIFQDANLIESLTAYENIALPLTIAKFRTSDIKGRVTQIALRLNISDVLHKFPQQMSGGQRQRVAAARAIIMRPALILADEPTGALDSKNSRNLLEAFVQLNQAEAATIIMVTHDSVAASYSSRVVFIKDGLIFSQMERGAQSRKEFFASIMDVVSYLGGEDADVH